MPLLPQKTWIGVLGGGQLGRMLCLAARRMGYQVVQWVGGPDSGPAGIADLALEGPFDCKTTLETFLEKADVVTVEFENIPSPLLRAIEERRPLYPSARAIEICQHRSREKNFLQKEGIPCVPFAIVTNALELAMANADLPGDVRVLKTAEFGYDGKGQFTLYRQIDSESTWKSFRAPAAVLEQKIDLAGELSVIVVRNPSGETATFDPAENIHTRHILDLSIVPARFPENILEEAEKIALQVADKLEYVGVMAVEFFLTRDNELLVNEIAPRPHNSGHHTIDACYTSQFEQQLRAICDLPLGDTDLYSPVVMKNLLGDLWPESGAPDWVKVLREPGAVLHLYGKREARRGRKMGHINFTGAEIDELLERAERVTADLTEDAAG